jgi:hypothetical protein
MCDGLTPNRNTLAEKSAVTVHWNHQTKKLRNIACPSTKAAIIAGYIVIPIAWLHSGCVVAIGVDAKHQLAKVRLLLMRRRMLTGTVLCWMCRAIGRHDRGYCENAGNRNGKDGWMRHDLDLLNEPH